MNINFLAKFLILLFLISCSSKTNSIIEQSGTGVVESINQTLNKSKEETLKALSESLTSHDIEISSTDSVSGTINTKSKKVTDSACFSHTPASCQVTFKAVVKEIQKETQELLAASEVNITYTENCPEINLTDIKCKDSNAEKLMLSIVDMVKTISK